MKMRQLERRAIVGSRFLAFAAVAGSLLSSVLMFFLGIINVYLAFRYGLASTTEETKAAFGTGAVINVIEGLDRFLIAIVLLYFSYGVYSLFIHPEESEEELALPAWLRVRQVSQLKQVVAELIVIILFVLFLRQALEAFATPHQVFSWPQVGTLLVLPFSTLLLAIALKLVELHPKKPAADKPDHDRKPTGDPASTKSSRSRHTA